MTHGPDCRCPFCVEAHEIDHDRYLRSLRRKTRLCNTGLNLCGIALTGAVLSASYMHGWTALARHDTYAAHGDGGQAQAALPQRPGISISAAAFSAAEKAQVVRSKQAVARMAGDRQRAKK